MSALLDHLARWRPFTALVVGDFMLDQLEYGNADRLSNDAPVPVLHVQRVEERAGGAANVCLDLAAMRGTVRAFGLVGTDSHASTLSSHLAQHGVDPAGLVSDGERPTTRKKSLIGLAQHRHAQKMFRLDYESLAPVGPAAREAILTRFCAALPGADVVCIEDYQKGVCTPELCRGVIDSARAAGVPVLVDPAAISDYAKYAGCTAITPNRSEAQKATGERVGDDAPAEHFAPLASRLIEQLGLEAAVITLDRQGALLMERGDETGQGKVVPTQARRVYDVTGAGDMVLAALAGARANGIAWPDAVRFANAAAGLEVEEFGVVPIPLERIHADMLARERATRGKFRTVDELLVELAAVRSTRTGTNGRAGSAPTIVFANGCFDVLHAGHVSLLRRAAALGDYLVVAINTDESVRRLKGPDRPVYSLQDRAQLLGELECVNAVVAFGDETPEALIRSVRPDVLVKGAQYEEAKIPGAAFVKGLGGRVALLDVVEGRSTTITLEKIRGS